MSELALWVVCGRRITYGSWPADARDVPNRRLLPGYAFHVGSSPTLHDADDSSHMGSRRTAGSGPAPAASSSRA